MIRRLNLIGKTNTPSRTDVNPFLVGLPDPRTDEDQVRLLAHNPFRDKDWVRREADPRRLPMLMEEVFIPTQRCIDISQKIFDAIHNGYYRRDPRRIDIGRYINSTNLVETTGSTYSEGLSISGVTGMGKSCIVGHVLSKIPQTIYHEEIGGHLSGVTQIVWFQFDIAQVNGLAALLIQMLRQVDKVLGTNEYSRQYASGKGNVDELVESVVQAFKMQFLGILVLDEIQNLSFSRGDTGERMRNLLIRLANNGTPTLLMGPPDSLRFLEKEGVSSQLERRAFSAGLFRIDPGDSPDDDDGRTIVRGLWRCQIMPKIAELTPAHLAVYFSYTAFIPKFVAHLHAVSQQSALRAGEEFLTPERIEHAAQNDQMLAKMRPFIQAFVNQDPLGLIGYKDSGVDYFKKKWGRETVRHHVAGSMVIEQAGAIQTIVEDPQAIHARNLSLAKRRMKKSEMLAQSDMDGQKLELYQQMEKLVQDSTKK